MLGNELNRGTFRGNAEALRLNSLAKVSTMKRVTYTNTDRKVREMRLSATPQYPTMLHYLASVLLRSAPSVILFDEDLSSVAAASKGDVVDSLATARR